MAELDIIDVFNNHIEKHGIKKKHVASVLERDYPNFNQVTLRQKTVSKSLRVLLTNWLKEQKADFGKGGKFK